MSLRFIRDIGARGQLLLLVGVFALTALLANLFISQSASAAIGSMTLYTTPTETSIPEDITLGPDGNIWYTAYGPTINTRIGKMTTSGAFTIYNNPAGPPISTKTMRGISSGSDGNLWFSEQSSNGDYIAKMTTSGVVLNQYLLGTNRGYIPMNMMLGPDGKVWFTKGSNGGGYVGKIGTDGVITTYYGGGGDVNDITLGPDGNLWFTRSVPGSSQKYISKITTSGVITSYQVGSSQATVPRGIVSGADGNLWFTIGSNSIGKITTSGVVTYYSDLSINVPQGITAGSDGALWFTESGTQVGRITTSGVVTKHTIPGGSSSGRQHIITGPDGAVWLLDWQYDQIIRIATELTSQTIAFTSIPPSNAEINGPTYNPIASSTSGLPVTITVDASSSGVCNIDSFGVVNFPGFGTCTLNANQAGNVDYNPAVQVQQSFDVAPVDADSSVTLDCPATATVGATITCTITMENNGPASARDASLTALFSSEMTGASVVGGGTLTGRYITWTTPSMSSVIPTTLTFNATASAPGKARLSAALLQLSPDPNSVNNITNATIVISQQ